eukprot:scaffold108758_cov30-Tisochrysis_lutea.AAC.1
MASFAYILAALELLALRPRGLGEPLPRHGGLGGADGGGSGAHRRDAERGGGRGEESEEKGDELHLGAERGKEGREERERERSCMREGGERRILSVSFDVTLRY